MIKSIFKRSVKKSGSCDQEQSPEAKSRLERQLYLARECPDPVFDISFCEISEVPKGVFSLCKVLQKETLLIHTNNLSLLKGGGNLPDLSGLRILDLHNNQLKSLPEDIGLLQSLQILNVEQNQLESLPESISSLSALQTLNLKGNQLKKVPDSLCQLCSLRFLDISENSIRCLPRGLCQVKTLEVIALDAAKMLYPSSAVCAEGTQAVMRSLCQDFGIDYIPPSAVLLHVLPSPLKPSPAPNQHGKDTALAIENTVAQYEDLKEKKRQERIALERQLEEDQRQQSILAAHASASKKHLVEFLELESKRLSEELMVAQHQKELEKEKLLETLTQVEQNASNLVMRLLEINEKARKTEEIMEKIEKERIEAEQWYMVHQEELENIRRKDVLSSMEEILKHNEFLSQKVNKCLNIQDEFVKNSKLFLHGTDEQVENVLSAKQSQQKVLVERLLKEESLQKEMFEVLQYEKDARHRRITSQITMIEQELAELTLLEIEQSRIKLDVQTNILVEKRKELTMLLMQLLDEQSKRRTELHERLVEMEERRLSNQIDYWLVQYQRLLDSKPPSLMDQEKQVECKVIKILEAAGASEYLPQFAKNHVSIETLLQMTDGDLVKIGVNETALRQAILKQTQGVLERKSTEEECVSLDPPAQVRSDETPAEIFAFGINSECVVCLNSKSSVVFLNCGHICACEPCAAKLTFCPLDRCDIVRRVHLTTPSHDASQDIF